MTEDTGPQAPAEEENAESIAPEREYYSTRRQQRALERTENARKRRGAYALLAVVSLVLVLVATESALSLGRVHRGVTVAGIDVGGMTPTAARQKLSASLARRAEETVTVTHQDKRWQITAEKVGLGFDEAAQIEAAMAVGRADDIWTAIGERARCWVDDVDVAPAPIAQDAMMDKVLSAIAKSTDVAPTNASVKLEGSNATVVEGKDGAELDRVSVRREILNAFSTAGPDQIEAPLVTVHRQITEDIASVAAQAAKDMLSGPVTVTFEKKKWTFSADEVSEWMAFRTVEETGGANVVLEPYIADKKAATPITKTLGTKVGHAAKNAEFKASSGKVTIIPSVDGVGPDIADLALTLTEELRDVSADRVVELRTSRTEPEITTEKARSMGIKERISSYTTTYASGNKPRVNNIHLLGDSLDGTLIGPGETFSFNETAGERTAEKGYQEAAAIVNGKLVPQLGGGVCQVGTTIFNTVFESGLPVLERRNHSFYISHYPDGRDATVSWGGPDFKFKNDTPDWILIVVGYSNSSITISLYGTDPGYEVSAQRGPWTNIRPYKTEEIDDPKLYEGIKRVEDGGVQGRSIVVKRIVSKGGKVLRTDSFVSNYKPKVEIVRVGTKPRPTTAPVTAP